jgi:hypothetical protein
MVRCIWCGEEIEDDKIREHIAEKHLGIHFTNGTSPADIKLQSMTEPEPQKAPEPQQSAMSHNNAQRNTVSHNVTSHDISHEIISHVAEQPKPKKRYLNAEEILGLIQNTNKQFPPKEIPECPLTKEGE